jgi:glycerol uptake facilitator-like aquaporin
VIRPDLHRSLAAEALGTALLLAVVVASGILANDLASDSAAIALIGNTFATVVVLGIVGSVLGPVSGAHLNPALTLVYVLRGEIPRATGALYAIAQVLGALAGVVIAHAMSSQELFQLSTNNRANGGALIAEAVATFGLVLVVLALRNDARFAAWSVAVYVGAAYWFTPSASLANPAATIARAFTDSFSGIAPIDVVGFVVSQLAAAMVAYTLAGWLLADRRSDAS